MFGISLLEIGVIALVALLVFGPEKLPEMARVLGKISGELKRNADSLRREFYNSVYEPAKEINSRIEREKRELVSSINRTLPEKDHQSCSTEEKKCDESDPGSSS